ncbi:MAG: ParA family protein [Pseudomonadota bacterium]
MGKTISVVNRKGGVGKTTLSVGLAEAFVSEYSSKTIVVDLDPQASATRFLLNQDGRFEMAIDEDKTLAGFLKAADGDIAAASDETVQRMLHIIKDRSEIDLALVANSDDYWDYEIDQIRAGAEQQLQDRIASLLRLLAERYDYLIVDCPPGQSLASEAAAKVSDLVLCPITPERMAVWGKELLEKYLERVAPSVKVRFVISRKQSSNLADEFVNKIQKSGGLLTPPGGGSKDFVLLSQSKQYQDRLEIDRINLSLQSLWGGKAVREIKVAAKAVKEELGA